MWKWAGLVGLGGSIVLIQIGCTEVLIGAAVLGVGAALLGGLSLGG
jgi:hypothetical protein